MATTFSCTCLHPSSQGGTFSTPYHWQSFRWLFQEDCQCWIITLSTRSWCLTRSRLCSWNRISLDTFDEWLLTLKIWRRLMQKKCRTLFFLHLTFSMERWFLETKTHKKFLCSVKMEFGTKTLYLISSYTEPLFKLITKLLKLHCSTARCTAQLNYNLCTIPQGARPPVLSLEVCSSN